MGFAGIGECLILVRTVPVQYGDMTAGNSRDGSIEDVTDSKVEATAVKGLEPRCQGCFTLVNRITS